MAVEEYEELQVNFDLEKNLRKQAESFAQEVGSSKEVLQMKELLQTWALRLNFNLKAWKRCKQALCLKRMIFV